MTLIMLTTYVVVLDKFLVSLGGIIDGDGDKY